MAFREWFRPPRHILTIFLSVAIVSAAALGWLSWLLVEQDRALDVQRAARSTWNRRRTVRRR